ncbi:hypothetical protein B0T17DRAFT_486898 [Bombardia bombarda]|uniref:Uncharacterized protein n=1 Tax=Bombardia bombarda TaxID=252184 RepID=A0AA40C9Z4_9PEZI|nr:hypothetical protein B0T17DRAFT_486898 [Bombardia bombarda]
MAGRFSKTVHRSNSYPATTKSPDSDVSPRTQVSSGAPGDYFSSNSDDDSQKPDASSLTGGASIDASTGGATSTAGSTSITGDDGLDESRRTSHSGASGASGASDHPTTGSRKSSTASVSFRPPRNPTLPQGHPRTTDNKRLRASSPEPVR